MKTTWDLTIFYHGLDDPKYEGDIAELKAVLQEYHELLTDGRKTMDEQELVESILGVHACRSGRR